MDELNRYQQSIIDSLEAENEKFQTLDKDIDIDGTLATANHYLQKLVAIKKEMQTLRHTSDQLKRRALALQTQTSKRIETIETEKYNQTEKEKRLQPVVPQQPPPHK